MKLSLRLHTTPQGGVQATLIQGADPRTWLSEINSWGINPAELSVFLMPAAIDTTDIFGLLVIRIDGDFSKDLNIREPYRSIGERLLIPQYAGITPQVNAHEWQMLLLYDWQIFHPNIGMVGFNNEDQLPLHQLLSYGEPVDTSWFFAESGEPIKPVLKSISIEPKDIVDLLIPQKSVGDKPLSDLLKKEFKTKDDLKNVSIRILTTIADTLDSRDRLKEGDRQSILGVFLDRLQSFIEKQLERLLEKREDEINRLLQLFQNDPNEALRYAIPLFSNYQGRGLSSTPGSTLQRRDPLDFSLTSLNGGVALDSWDIDRNRHQSLYQQYLQAANQKIKEGDFRKAAYIYAHLLGDLKSAANVLVQGKCFHEAAILYRDHLKDLDQAALCFEKARLYEEAIVIYLQKGNYEKTGDLYVQLGQWEEAKKMYSQIIEKSIEAGDYLNAARLYRYKLKDYQGAKNIFLEGWELANNQIACLIGYFRLVMESNNNETLDQEIYQVYDQYVPTSREDDFMEVLKKINTNQDFRGKLPQTVDVIHRILSKNLELGKTGYLNMLPSFLPYDSLLDRDLGYFLATVKSRQSNKGPKARLDNVINLSPKTEWYDAIILNHCLLVLGICGKIVFLHCDDLEGRKDSFLVSSNESHLRNSFFTLPNNSNYIGITHLSEISPNLQKECSSYLGSHTYFLSTKLFDSCMGIAAVNEKKIAQLINHTHEGYLLQYCNLKGEILESYLCVDKSGDQFIFPGSVNDTLSIMHYHNGYFYFIAYNGSVLFWISESGKTFYETLPSKMSQIAFSDGEEDFRIAISFFRDECYGLLLYRKNEKGLESGEEIFEPLIENLLLIPNGLVVTGSDRLSVYDTDNYATPGFRETITVSSPIVKVFRSPKKNQIGILTEMKEIIFYELNS